MTAEPASPAPERDRARARGTRVKFTMSRHQYDAAMSLLAEAIEVSRQPPHIVARAQLALGQMRRQDQRQRAKKEPQQ